MRLGKSICLGLLMLSSGMVCGAADLHSIYTSKPDDPEGYYFTPENYGIKADGKADVSVALQEAVNTLKREKNFGILYIPEGKYRLSRTIYIPAAVRLIGYGAERPEFILSKNSPGFEEEPADDKGKAKYMFWFTGGIVEDESHVNDANAGTFYSAISNINITIEDGNPYAVAIRAHFAQHSFVSHVAVNIGKGKAGLFDAGNFLDNVAFYGGDYGIYTTKASPGWQIMLVDSYFEGQRKSALKTQESGLAMVNIQARNVPMVIDIEQNFWDKLFIEDGYFEDVKGPLINIALEDNPNNQINFRDVFCRNVPTVAEFKTSGRTIEAAYKTYRINSFIHGLQMASMDSEPEYVTDIDMEPLRAAPEWPETVLPVLPELASCVNLKTLGAKGDGTTDDTEAIQAAIDKYDNIYVPQGWYLISKTLKLRPETKLIGLHPYGTQFRLAESSPEFSGFGGPVAMVESAEGGENFLSGIGICTGGYNYRAVGVKWMSGEKSFVNDVKFIGGHGSMWKPVPGQTEPKWSGWGRQKISTPDDPVTETGKDLAWDNQYWSFWVTNGGGGIFQDIWTANTYASAGFYAEGTSTPAKIYAMSIEHHVREEVRFNNVSNWKVYCMQTEEETRESSECQPIEMDLCHDMTFANLYNFRVIRVNRPYHSSVRMRSCKGIEFLNLHNYAQTKYSNDVYVFDVNRNLEVRPWELARLTVTGNEASMQPEFPGYDAVQAGSDFDFTEGASSDSKGNVYFCDNRMKRIFRWSASTGEINLVADFPWKPIFTAFDTEDNLLVGFRYDPQPGYMVDGSQESVEELPDAAGTSFSSWGNSGFSTRFYTMDPDNPEETIMLLDLVPMGSVDDVAKALYPSNRWRDFHDFDKITLRVPEKCYVAPDGKTIIPYVYDLARCSSLVPAYPGKKMYASNEYDKRTVSCDVNADGTLSNLKYFTETGEFGLTAGPDGNIYIADGDVYVFSPEGKKLSVIKVPERPSTLAFGGKDGRTLFITGRHRVFTWRLR